MKKLVKMMGLILSLALILSVAACGTAEPADKTLTLRFTNQSEEDLTAVYFNYYFDDEATFTEDCECEDGAVIGQGESVTLAFSEEELAEVESSSLCVMCSVATDDSGMAYLCAHLAAVPVIAGETFDITITGDLNNGFDLASDNGLVMILSNDPLNEEPDFTDKTLDVSAYGPILENYHQAVFNYYDVEQCEETDVCYLVGMMDGARENMLGYALLDMDENGHNELLIGETAEGYEPGLVYDVFTLEDGEAVRVFSSGERSRIYYIGNNCFAYYGSNSAEDSVFTTWQFEDGQFVDLETEPSEDYLLLNYHVIPEVSE